MNEETCERLKDLRDAHLIVNLYYRGIKHPTLYTRDITPKKEVLDIIKFASAAAGSSPYITTLDVIEKEIDRLLAEGTNTLSTQK